MVFANPLRTSASRVDETVTEEESTGPDRSQPPGGFYPSTESAAPGPENIAPTGIPAESTIEEGQVVSPIIGDMNLAYSQPGQVIPEEAIITPEMQEVQADELLSPETGMIGEQAGIAAPQPTEAQQIAASEEMAAPTYEPALVGTGSQMQVVQGDLSDRAIITDPVTGELRPESKAEAVVRESPPEAFIADQLTTLLTGMEGGEIPSWAKPAVDAAEAELAQRGMGNSSVARDSLYNAIIQSALPIATGDAATAQQTFLANLNNEQQAVMFNAAQMANMDMANATYAQQAQAQNAQAFLQMDFANLDYEMQTAVINQQAMEQAMLSDQAAQNAASQFNATSESQTQQFIESLRVQIADANASRQLAADQFNTEQTLAIESFNSDLAFQRDKFNAQNALLIEQSNVEWRRAVNTANTVAINEANQQNAMNAFNLSTTALASLWQEYRDNAKMAFESAENKLDRQNRITLVSMGADADAAIAASEANSSLGAGLGAAAGFFLGGGPAGAAIGAGIGGAIGSMW